MNWKNRLKNYNFWISIFSAVLLILQALKIEFDIAYVNEIFTAVLGLLVVIGIISDPTKTATKTQETTEIKTQKDEVIEEKDVTQNITEKKGETLPIISQNETNNVNFQNDFQTVIETIRNDLNKVMEELKETKINYIKENESKEESLEVAPVVAETDNPYLMQ